jgi:hypothetical protein
MRVPLFKLWLVGVVLVAVLAAFCGLALKPAPCLVRLTVTATPTNSARPFALIQLTNGGSRSLTYWGYGTNAPRYSYRFQTPTGPTNYCPFWCGTGLRPCVLGARRSVEFHALVIDSPSAYQVALACQLPTPWDRLRDVAPAWLANRLPRPRQYLVLTDPFNGRTGKTGN